MDSVTSFKQICLKPTVSLRAAYTASMAKAINEAREGCRAVFPGTLGPWLGPQNIAIRREARACLECLPSVLIDIILNEYGDFIDAEYFSKNSLYGVVPNKPWHRSVIMMTIGLDDREFFNCLIMNFRSAYSLEQGESYEEFKEFGASPCPQNRFMQMVVHVAHYCCRGADWRIDLFTRIFVLFDGFRYTLMGSGPVSEVERSIRASGYRLLSRNDLVEIAMSGDANPEIIEFLKRF
jgi:hypothetical protein